MAPFSPMGLAAWGACAAAIETPKSHVETAAETRNRAASNESLDINSIVPHAAFDFLGTPDVQSQTLVEVGSGLRTPVCALRTAHCAPRTAHCQLCYSSTKMEFTNLGRTGLKVSRICLGAMTYGDKSWREWVLPEEESLPYIARALELGINFFDTANVYSLGVSEEILGKALKAHARREDVIIATKVFSQMGPGPNDKGLSRKHILDQCDASLKRLQTDYIDLYQTHRFDYETPIEETVDALDSLVRAGKVRYLGASSMFAWQFMKMLGAADKRGLHRFVSMQNHYNLVYREEEREMLPLCAEEGIAVIPWSPLARGLLT